MAEYVSKEKAVTEQMLYDWYISSVDDSEMPVWTDEHIEELLRDFLVIPIETPAADVSLVVHGHWIPIFLCDSDKRLGLAADYECSECNGRVSNVTYSRGLDYEFCPRCGAKMDGKEE